MSDVVTVFLILSTLFGGASFASSPGSRGPLAMNSCLSAIRLIADYPTHSYAMLSALYSRANPPALGESIGQDNARYVRLLETPEARRLVFFHVSLKALKRLNDKVFLRDGLAGKEDVNAARNLFRVLLHENVEAHPALRRALVGRFLDFKSAELAIDPTMHPEPHLIEGHLREVGVATQMQFSRAMEIFARNSTALVNAVLSERGISSDFRTWHSCGIGTGNPDYAAIAARLAAKQRLGDGAPRLTPVTFDPAMVEAHIDKIERELKPRLIAGLPPGTPLFAPYEDTSHLVLSPDAIDILRRVEAVDRAGYVDAVKDAFRKRLGATLTIEQTLSLQELFSLADDLQPTIRVAEPTSIRWEEARHGALSVDFGGQNVFNMLHTLGAIARAQAAIRGERRVGELAVALLREGEGRATGRLLDLRRAFDEARLRAGIPGEYQKTGDDGAVIFTSPQGRGARARMYRELSVSGHPVSVFRLVWLWPVRNARNEIDPGATGRESARSEDYEKTVRKALYGRVRLGAMERTGIASVIDPMRGTFGIDVFGEVPEPHRVTLGDAIARTVIPAGYRSEGMTLVP